MAKIGWIGGTGRGRYVKVGNTGAVTAGDLLTYDSDAGSPYVMRVTDGENLCLGVSRDTVPAPTNDGDYEVFMYDDPGDNFRLNVITGTATANMTFDVCDIGVSGTSTGADVTASTDNLIIIDKVNSTTQIECRIDFCKFGARTGAEA